MEHVRKLTLTRYLAFFCCFGVQGYSDELESGQFPLTIGDQTLIVGPDIAAQLVLDFGDNAFGAKPRKGGGMAMYSRLHSRDPNQDGDELHLIFTGTKYSITRITLMSESAANVKAIADLVIWLKAMGVPGENKYGRVMYEYGGWRFQHAPAETDWLESMDIFYLAREKDLNLN